ANQRHLSANSPSVRKATHNAPCNISVANAATPTTTVYQSKIPNSPFTPKSLHNGKKKNPEAPSGTPRTTFPSAAPKNIASNALAPQNTTSHNGRHSAPSTCARNSIAIPRSISSHNTTINGK